MPTAFTLVPTPEEAVSRTSAEYQYGIPNYHLKACYDAVPKLHRKGPLTMRKSLASAGLKLWDEDRKQLVGFPD
jgi:hypothetical protein